MKSLVRALRRLAGANVAARPSSGGASEKYSAGRLSQGDTPPSRTLLSQRIALVTGGSGLLGAAICKHLAAHGARVAVHCHQREEEADRVVGEISAAGGTALRVRADIRDQAQVEAMVRAAVERFGTVDILVNNASTVPTAVGMKGFLDHTWDDYQRYIDTVLRGSFHCCRAVLPGMVQQKRGRIVNIGTASLNEINAHLNPYVTAKGGLLGMSRSLAEEFGKFDVTVNLVAPGWIWPHGDREPGSDEGRVFRDRSPLGDGLVRPRDVAGVVVMLASDLASNITGAYIPVCAGQVTTG